MKKYSIDEIIGAILLAVMCLITCTNVFCRYILHASISASEEICTLFFVLLSLLGSAVAVKRRAHLGLTILTDALPKKITKWIIIFGYVVGVVFCCILIWKGISMAQNEYIYQVKTISMNWPEWIFGTFVPIGGFFIAIRFIQCIVQDVKKKDGE